MLLMHEPFLFTRTYAFEIQKLIVNFLSSVFFYVILSWREWMQTARLNKKKGGGHIGI